MMQTLSQTLARGREISCAEIKERPGQPQQAPPTPPAEGTPTLFMLSRKIEEPNLYSILQNMDSIAVLKITPVRKSEDS